MVKIHRTVTEEAPTLEEAISRSDTGAILDVDPAPKDIEDAEKCFATRSGLLSFISDNVFNNDRLIWSSTERENERSIFPVYPWYDQDLVRCNAVKDEQMVHDFHWLIPPDPNKPSKVSRFTDKKPAYSVKASKLEIISLPSGKGLVLVIDEPEKKILLLKNDRFIGIMWDKITENDVTVAWTGDSAIIIPTPTSVVVGEEVTAAGSTTKCFRFWRGHHWKKVGDIPGLLPRILRATEEDLYYSAKESGQEVMLSVRTRKPMYTEPFGDLYGLSKALVRHQGKTIEANGKIVTRSFVSDLHEPIPAEEGLFYVLGGRLMFLVIKGTPK